MNKEQLVIFEKLKIEKETLNQEINYLKEIFKFDSQKVLLKELNEKINNSVSFWDDVDNAQKITQKASQIEKLIKDLESLSSLFQDFSDYLVFASSEDEYIAEAEKVYAELSSKVKIMKVQAMLNGKYDNYPAIVSITPGAGGTEAQDWAEMLFRMYQMYAEKMKFKLSILNYEKGETAGIKSITFSLSGNYAYGFLKCEMGVHRLVRISPFDSSARRHTSFASVEVVPEVEGSNDVEIKPEDIRIDTYRASGAGGQHINKTDSAVRITHFPTGIVVTCQNERSQIQNKEKAMIVLKSKLLQLKIDEENKALEAMKGDVKKIEWGSQIRSYVFCPYTLVKDHRTNYEETNVQSVMDGNIQNFIEEYLKRV